MTTISKEFNPKLTVNNAANKLPKNTSIISTLLSLIAKPILPPNYSSYIHQSHISATGILYNQYLE